MRLRRLRSRREDPASRELAAPALTPLVDMMTLVLLFLLRAWSADPPVGLVESGFDLPISAVESPVDRRLTVDVGSSGIHVDGRRVVGTRFYEVSEETLVREVYDVMLRRSGEPVALRVDADVPWIVVRKVLFTLHEAGVSDVSLVAASRAGL
jgi:biopolymer transport protein ExbD